MSHFTHVKTRFQNLFYLKKALNSLNISYNTQKKSNSELESIEEPLIISQLNGHNIEFNWNGREYELLVDMSFWDQPYPIENFIDQVSQKYASEVIIGEGKKTGFQPIKSRQNIDGSHTLVLERWNNI